MKALILILSLSLLFGGVIRAQQPAQKFFTLKGKVVDDLTGEPLAYATAAVVVPMELYIIKGVVTNERGEFELKVLKGEFNFAIRHLGYQDFGKPLNPEMEDVIDFGTIRLKTQAERLGVVTVKPLVEISVDEVKYDLTQDPDRETSTLHTILEKVPLMRKTPMGDLYVDAPDKTFVVVRNGKVDALFSGNLNDILKALPAKGFASVTVMLAPPERYGDVDYVVSIEADPSARLFGAVGMTSGELKADDGKIEMDGSVIASFDKFRFSLVGTFANTNAPKEEQRMEQTQHKDGSRLKQLERMEKSGEGWGAGTTFSYDLAKKHFVTGRFSYDEGDARERKTQHTTRYAEQSGAIASESDFLKRSHNKAWSVRFNYQYDFDKKQRTLNIAYLFRTTPTAATDGGTTPSGSLPRLSTENDSYEHTVQVHYYDPITKTLNLETGAGYIYRNYTGTNHYFSEETQGVWTEDESSFYGMDKLNHIINGYAQISYRLKLFSVSAGVKADYLYDGDGTRLQTGDSVQLISEKSFSFSPEISLRWRFPKSKISDLSLTGRVLKNRPSLKRLSPYVDYSNPNLIVVGNPNLKQQAMYNVSLRASWGSLGFGPSWVYSNNVISSNWYEDEEGRVVQSYENGGLLNSISMGVNYSYNKHNISVGILSKAAYSYSKSQQDEPTTTWNVSMNLNAGYTFKNQLSCGLTGGFYKDFSSGLHKTEIRPVSLSLQLRKKLFKERVDVELTTGDLLHLKTKTTTWVETNDFAMRQEFEKRSIPISLTVKLRIGSFKVKPMRQARRQAVIDDVMTD